MSEMRGPRCPCAGAGAGASNGGGGGVASAAANAMPRTSAVAHDTMPRPMFARSSPRPRGTHIASGSGDSCRKAKRAVGHCAAWSLRHCMVHRRDAERREPVLMCHHPCHAMPCRAMWCAPVSCAARLGGIEARLGRPCTRYLGHDPTTPTSQCAALATLVPLEVVGGGPGRGLRHRARQPDCLLRVRQSCCCMDQAVRGSSGYEYEVAPCPARQGGDDTAPHRTALHHDAGADGLPRTGRLPFPTASTSPI